MRRACRRVVLTSGRHPDPHPDFSMQRPLVLIPDPMTWPRLTRTSWGVPTTRRARSRPGQLGRGSSVAIALSGARDREDQAPPRARAAGGDARVPRPLRFGVRPRAGSAVLRLRRCVGRTSRSRAGSFQSLAPRPNSSRPRLPLAVRPRERCARWQDSTRYRSHRAVRRLLELLAATKPLVLVLDDFHWADAGSVELPADCCAGHRPQRCSSMAHRPRPCPNGSQPRSSEGRVSQVTRVEVGAMTRDEARELLGEEVDVAGIDEESGGNPFYLEQLTRRPGGRRQARLLDGHWRPCCRRRFAERGARHLSDDGRRPRGCGGRRRPVRAGAGGGGSYEVRGVGDGSNRRASGLHLVRELTCGAAFASGIRSFAGRSMKSRPAAGGSAPTSGAHNLLPAAPVPRRGRTMSSDQRVRATRKPSPSCGRRARERFTWRRQARHVVRETRCASSRRLRRRRSGPSCCSPVRVR